jgi:hypothetical protein
VKHLLRFLGVIGFALTAAPAVFAQTLANGSFATGDLTGWTAVTVDGGEAAVVKQGTSFSAHPGSDQVPFPGGPGSYAALLRASASTQSLGILTSAPFVPRSGKLAFYTLSESAAVAPKLLLLTAGADPINPAVSDLLLVTNVVHDAPGTGPTAVFQRQELDISPAFAAGEAVRLQFRQPATPNGSGFFTLITDIDDTGKSPDINPPAAVGDLAVSLAGPFSVTLTFTAPKDTGAGSAGGAASYDVRYGLSPLTELNFDSAAGLATPPAPSPADTPESVTVTGLDPIQRYYFAVRSRDAAGNRSPISNVAGATTAAAQPGDPGLTAQYFKILDGAPLPPNRANLFVPDRLIGGTTRIEPLIDIDYETDRAAGVPHDRFGVRYTGQITPKYGEVYTFCTLSDDGTRLWISEGPIDPSHDPALLSHGVQSPAAPARPATPTALQAGTKYNLVEEYEQGSGPAVNRLLWKSASQAQEVVPSSALTSPADPPPSPIGRATGSVLDENGNPVPGFTLRLTSDSGAAASLLTDGSGAFTALLPAAVYRLSGGDATRSVPSSTPPVAVSPGGLTLVPPVTLGPPEPLSLGVVNGDFATGDLTGWTATGYNGGLVQLEQNGKQYFGEPVPYPDGIDRAADVRSWDDPLHLGDTASTGILVSDPFLPNAPTLSFWTHSQNKPVAPQLLLLRTDADPVQPRPEDILLIIDVRNDFPGMGSEARFERQEIDISEFYNATDPTKGTPVRLEVRQHTLENGSGWYTLFTGFDAGPTLPLPLRKGDLNYDGSVDVGDAVIGLRIVVGEISPVPPGLLAQGDVAPKKPDGASGDGVIDVDDVIRILRRTVGLEPDPWP